MRYIDAFVWFCLYVWTRISESPKKPEAPALIFRHQNLQILSPSHTFPLLLSFFLYFLQFLSLPTKMGCFLFLSLKPTAAASSSSAAFFVLFLITLLSFLSTPSNADPDSPKLGDIATTFPASPPSDEDTVDSAIKPNSFRPSIIVIVGVLTTLFTLTFLLLLYAKHCKRGSFVVNSSGGPPRAAALRKNSGIDRTVVESLPVFRFGSLRGHKDGLECAVCLTRFEPTEVLRLLPKCKHAFHVECVDTWLDAHSTCPLCRYRVDPEDILLIEETRFLPHQNSSHPQTPAPPHQNDVVIDIENDSSHPGFRRVSGRHSSALERQPGSSNDNTSSFRRSFDSWTWFRKKTEPTSTSTSAAGGIDRPRKDGLLLPQEKTRLEHRIIVSSPRSSNTGNNNGNSNGVNQRWSDVEASDLLYLQSEMIMSDSDVTRQRQQQGEVASRSGNGAVINGGSGSGRGVISERSVSEITGLSRFASRGSGSNDRSSNHHNNTNTNHRSQTQNQNRQQQRQLKLASRWVAWISSHHSRLPPPVRPDRQKTPPPPPPPPLPSTVPTG
ncbi:RING-H2 finger protein ATL43 [Argentina anserina]|uniref:RING-H2 finger protein ATL43 n=1 Tax=Argentina anserina TaxID=57926 RepID=UPI00217641C1|nr:RING-H2 finger protein ATL43 [Potentilla anserina]